MAGCASRSRTAPARCRAGGLTLQRVPGAAFELASVNQSVPFDRLLNLVNGPLAKRMRASIGHCHLPSFEAGAGGAGHIGFHAVDSFPKEGRFLIAAESEVVNRGDAGEPLIVGICAWVGILLRAVETGFHLLHRPALRAFGCADEGGAAPPARSFHVQSHFAIVPRAAGPYLIVRRQPLAPWEAHLPTDTAWRAVVGAAESWGYPSTTLPARTA